MKSSKKNSILFVALCSAMLFSCGETKPSSTTTSLEPTTINPTTEIPTTTPEPTTVTPTTSTYPSDYFGKVAFQNIFVYGDDFDGVKVRPFLTKPEEAKDEVFEYTIKNDDICYIEDDKVYFLREGSTVVTAQSEHLKGTFTVFATEYFDFKSQGNSRIDRAVKNMKVEDTVFIGDSFFEFWANQVKIDEKFSDAFADYATLNLGISATTTHDWRVISRNIIEKTNVQPKNIVLNIGINNVDDDLEGGKTCGRNVQLLIEDYLEAYPETNIYYFSITRCSGTFASKWDSHEGSNTYMKAYCETQERVHYLDVMALYGDNYARYEQDGLHPNQEGYNLFKQLILENVPMETKK